MSARAPSPNDLHLRLNLHEVAMIKRLAGPMTMSAFVRKLILDAAQCIAATCRECGCTEDNACMTPAGPCHWAELDLCSAPDCLRKAARKAKRTAARAR